MERAAHLRVEVHMRHYSMSWLLACMTLIASPLRSLAEDNKETILVIVHKDVAAASLSRDELRPIFQTKKSAWPDGSALRAFNLPDSDSVRHGFDAAVLGLDPDRVVRYWIDRKIRGGDRPPVNAPSNALVVKIVGKTPGAIGYVDGKAALDANVRVVAKIVNGQVMTP
jgi:ABC-type phosphate transport system substrate-binding protein